MAANSKSRLAGDHQNGSECRDGKGSVGFSLLLSPRSLPGAETKTMWGEFVQRMRCPMLAQPKVENAKGIPVNFAHIKRQHSLDNGVHWTYHNRREVLGQAEHVSGHSLVIHRL